MKCLEKSPGRRYHSAQALADDLERWLADLPIRARRTRLPYRAIKWARRRPAAAGLVLMASVATALAVGGIAFTTRLKSDVARTGMALLEEKEKRREFEKELVESHERKLRMEEDQYFQAIVAADQSPGGERPDAGRAPAGGLPAPAPELGMATLEPAASLRAADHPGPFGIPLPRLPARHDER